jgi:hypothetical protein
MTDLTEKINGENRGSTQTNAKIARSRCDAKSAIIPSQTALIATLFILCFRDQTKTSLEKPKSAAHHREKLTVSEGRKEHLSREIFRDVLKRN